MAWIELSSCEKKEKKKNYSLSIEEKREIVAIGPDELCTQKMLFVECEVVSSSSSSAVAEAHLVQVPAIISGPQEEPGADHGPGGWLLGTCEGEVSWSLGGAVR